MWKHAISAIERVALKSLTAGNFVWFGAFLVVVCGIFKLDGKDLKELVLSVIATHCWLGYVGAVGSVTISITLLRWRDAVHQQEINRVSEVKNTLIQKHLELPIISSVKKPDQK